MKAVKKGMVADMFIYLLTMVLLLPVISIILGKSWMKKPPKKINDFYGYRTSRSMASKESWNYAHRYYGRLWYLSGIPVLILSIIAMFLWKDIYEIVSLVIILVQLAITCLAIIPTERSLKKNFDRNGYPISLK